MSSNTSSVVEVIEKASKSAGKASKKAVKIVKKVVESLTESDVSTSFSDHSVPEKVSNMTMVLGKAKGILNNPKIKWLFLGVLLCIAAFLYFRMQKKKLQKLKQMKDELNVEEEPATPKQIQRQQVAQPVKRQEIDVAALERQMRQKLEAEYKQKKLSESSEEVFIEDEHILNHNLTAEEMNSIDKQLEDVNIDNLIH